MEVVKNSGTATYGAAVQAGRELFPFVPDDAIFPYTLNEYSSDGKIWVDGIKQWLVLIMEWAVLVIDEPLWLGCVSGANVE